MTPVLSATAPATRTVLSPGILAPPRVPLACFALWAGASEVFAAPADAAGPATDLWMGTTAALLATSATMGWLLVRQGRKLREERAKRLGVEAEIKQAVAERTAHLEQVVAEQGRAEESLRTQQAFVRTVIDAVPAPVFVRDGQGRYLLANEAMVRATGVPLPELIGRRPDEFPGNARASAITGELVPVGTDRAVSEERSVDADGRTRWLEVTTRALVRPDGARWTLGIASDVTERKIAELALVRAKETADASNEAKGDFLARMSHEIRTPMNAVIGMTNLLLGTTLDAQQRDFAETVRHSGESLLSVINDILDFSKIEAGELHMETLDFDLVETLEDSLELLAERAHGKGIELILSLADGLPTKLRGDPGRLRQVLLNLVGNAVKFTDQGEVVVAVSHIAVGRDTGDLRVEVRDTGIGLSAAAQANLFQPFFQPDSAANRRYGGTGLGLVISKRLVELMGGEIGLESAPGKGSTFWFTVRLKRREEPAPQASRWPLLAGARVLVAVGSPSARRVLVEQLRTWGMAIHGQSGTGAGALALLGRDSGSAGICDIVVTDTRLEDMEGADLARAIREQHRSEGLPVVLLAEVGQRLEPSELEAAGIAAWLSKPAKHDLLGDRLSALLRSADGPIPTSETLLEPRTGSPKAVEAEPVLPRDLRVLLAEDNPTNQKLAVHFLQRLGLTPDIATNGLEVLSAFERQHYDLVLMDCHMPEMDGYEATRRLRQDRRLSGDVRIVALTAAAMTGDRDRCLAAGMDDYLTKPLRLEDLRLTLVRHLVTNRPTSSSGLAAATHGVAGKEANTAAHLDHSALAEIIGDDAIHGRKLLVELLDLFLRGSPEQLARMAAQCRDKQFEALRETAHSLKGSSATLGAGRLAQLCRRLEIVAHEGDLAGSKALVEGIREEFTTVAGLLGKEKAAALA